jgi:hypothetical protein
MTADSVLSAVLFAARGAARFASIEDAVAEFQTAIRADVHQAE